MTFSCFSRQRGSHSRDCLCRNPSISHTNGPLLRVSASGLGARPSSNLATGSPRHVERVSAVMVSEHARRWPSRSSYLERLPRSRRPRNLGGNARAKSSRSELSQRTFIRTSETRDCPNASLYATRPVESTLASRAGAASTPIRSVSPSVITRSQTWASSRAGCVSSVALTSFRP